MMELRDLERNLEKGNHFGFVKETDSDEYMGWVSLEKRQVNLRGLELISEDEDPMFHKEQRVNKEKPYVIRVCEMKKSVYDSDDYPDNSDYNMNEIYRFKSLEDVGEFIEVFNFKLEDIKWYVDIPHD